jgi:hypothetical protein
MLQNRRQHEAAAPPRPTPLPQLPLRECSVKESRGSWNFADQTKKSVLYLGHSTACCHTPQLTRPCGCVAADGSGVPHAANQQVEGRPRRWDSRTASPALWMAKRAPSLLKMLGGDGPVAWPQRTLGPSAIPLRVAAWIRDSSFGGILREMPTFGSLWPAPSTSVEWPGACEPKCKGALCDTAHLPDFCLPDHSPSPSANAKGRSAKTY